MESVDPSEAGRFSKWIPHWAKKELSSQVILLMRSYRALAGEVASETSQLLGLLKQSVESQQLQPYK